MTYTTGLNASKALKEAGTEIESEKFHFQYPSLSIIGDDSWFLGHEEDDRVDIGVNRIPSYSLSELSEVFRILGEKKGREWEIISDGAAKWWWLIRYGTLCELWATTQSQEKCDEYVINLIKQ
jgi:hypothetical protein